MFPMKQNQKLVDNKDYSSGSRGGAEGAMAPLALWK